MPQGTRFVCFNGRFIKEDDFRLERNNRAFKYGDGFFETMHYGFGRVQLYAEHIKRLNKAMELLKMRSNILSQPKILHDEIVHLINANHYFRGARIRLSVFRSGGGFYKPESSEASYLIESAPLISDQYPLNEKGIRMGIYTDLPKTRSIFNQFKTIAMPISVLASIQMGDNDDMFLLNEDQQIIESTHSNIFFVQGDTVYTPSLESGCLHGIMRKQVIDCLETSHLKIEENDDVKEKDITQFDEIFLSNAVRGVQWIGAYKDKRFDYKISREISQMVVKRILSLS